MTAVFQQKLRQMIRPEILVGIGFLVLAFTGLNGYVQWSSAQFMIGLLALPFLMERSDVPASRPYLHLLAALVFLGLCYLLPVKSFLFFAIGFSIFFLIGNNFGPVRFSAVVILFLCSPVFGTTTEIFSFPIRLQLSSLAGNIFSFFSEEVAVRGNVIHYLGREFSVDPACMGLSMLTVSFSLGMLLLGFYQKRLKKEIVWWKVLLYLSAIFLLNVISNLCRIILLVLFGIMPETPAHELTGLVCLLVYVFIPAAWMANFIVGRTGRTPSVKTTTAKPLSIHYSLVLLLLSILVMSRFQQVDTYKRFATTLSHVNGYKVTVANEGVLKLDNGSSLVYIKFLRGFYDSEHHPMICWKGSGYEFKNVQDQKVDGLEIYTARLVRGDQALYTAWWYSNGVEDTNSQMKWRWSVARGSASYAIVNVTSATPENLHKEVRKIIRKKSIAPLFHRS